VSSPSPPINISSSVNNNAGADSKVSITLAKVTYKADLLASLIANGNLVLKATSPTLTFFMPKKKIDRQNLSSTVTKHHNRLFFTHNSIAIF
jgi:hypothetical protein